MTLAGFRIRSDLMRIRIWPDPAFFLVADPDPRFDDLKLKKKFTAGNLIFIFLIKSSHLLIPRPP
jgi:hypothetical protein